MGLRVGVIGTGEMGAGVGGHLVAHGAEVLTTLAGRGAASAERVHRAGITVVEDLTPLARTCSIVLSIVPPDRAVAVAEAFAAACSGASERPLFVDCNSIALETSQQIERIVTAAGARYLDGSIIGAPPSIGKSGPHIYAAGAAADVAAFADLAGYGLEIRPLDGPIGTASALKMCYAGITKAYIGIGIAMFDIAESRGVGAALAREFAEKSKSVAEMLPPTTSRMYRKANRWIGEMREIEAFAGGVTGLASLYEGLAQYYSAVAEAEAAKKQPA
jgi:3-hydroxyisobutyrate dehydrogenase-like beta-hydroxyacid dehydrogenase